MKPGSRRCGPRGVGDRFDRLAGKGVTEHRTLLDHLPLFVCEGVEAGGDECLQPWRDLQGAQFADEAELSVVPFDKPPTVEQAANGLHGVERDALGAAPDPFGQRFGKSRDQPGQELVHVGWRERLEMDQGGVCGS